MMKFIDEKILVIAEELKRLSRKKLFDITAITYAPSGYLAEVGKPDDSAYRPFDTSTRVKGRDAHYRFRFCFDAPAVEPGKILRFAVATGREGTWDATNPQITVYFNGKLVQGLDTNHTEFPVEPNTHFEVEAYYYTGMTGEAASFLPCLYEIDAEIDAAYYDFKVPAMAAQVLDEDDVNRAEILKYLNYAERMLDLRNAYSPEFYAGLRSAREFLKKEFYENPAVCGKFPATVSTVGHTHIDVAWLWTLAQTREKAQRSFSTVLNLQKEFPEYIFMSSQPQLYEFVRQSNPELFAEIQAAAKAGKWEVEGAMWLEADCNLTSGESLIRQIVHGKRFMKQFFDTDSHILWLPDVFGYSVALPQILKKTGVDTFVTSKISWNEFNQMPNDAFLWRGVDGSEVFAYFLTARDNGADFKGFIVTYNGDITPAMVLGTYERFQNKDYNRDTVITFGYGDGGGGPTREMLENQRRMRTGLPGFPATKMEKAGDFLARVRKNFDDNCRLTGHTPRWSGELYLELHRGTYTSIGKNKRNNRKSEFLFENAEKLAVTDRLLNGGTYPAEEIYDAWTTILLNQFHDIIPGSSIFEVYEDSDKQYAALSERGARIIAGKLASLTRRIAGKGTLVYNPTSFAADLPVRIDGVTRIARGVPALGWKVFSNFSDEKAVEIHGNTAENEFFTLTVEPGGGLKIYDKRNARSVFAEGKSGNVLEAYEDFPRAYDDWEITNYYKDKMWRPTVKSIKPITDGDRAGFEVVYTFSRSTLTQRIWLYSRIDRIDIETTADWHEQHILLKAAFPTDLNTNTVTCEVQYGSVERPTHENTSWDAAKFEICAQKWADLSDNGYGVSVLNDCKYGYSAEGSTLKLTLIKCGTYPNTQADQGHHKFVYSVYPHKGNVRVGDTVKQSYLLNLPAITAPVNGGDGSLPDEYSLVSVDRENVIVEAVKQAYDSDATVIRAYESSNARTKTTVTLGFDANSAVLCDMLENEIAPLKIQNRQIELTLNPFEIVTVKVK